MTTREPEWTPYERMLLLASREVDAFTGRYGEWLPDATSPKASPYYQGEDKITFVPDGPYINYAERVVEDAQSDFRKQNPDRNMNGMFWMATSSTP